MRWESEIGRSAELLAQDRLGAELVCRIEVGEEKADGNGAEALVPGAAGGGAYLVLVERLELRRLASRDVR